MPSCSWRRLGSNSSGSFQRGFRGGGGGEIPAEDIFVLGVIAVEWSVATWLLTGFGELWARRAALAVLGIFIAVATWHLLAGNTDCGCFGNLSIHPAWSLSIDMTALAAIYWFGRDVARERPRPIRFPKLFARIALSAFFSASLLASTTIAGQFLFDPSNSGSVVLIDPGTMGGKPFALLEYAIDGGDRTDLSSGHRTVLLLDHECGKCRQYLERLEDASLLPCDPAELRIVDVAIASQAGLPPTPFRQVRLRPGVRFIAPVPLDPRLEGGVVKSVRNPE